MTIGSMIADCEDKYVARRLLCHVLDMTKEELILNKKGDINNETLYRFQQMYGEVTVEGRPLAYVLGYEWFMGRKFVVDERVLIPRAETEELVALAVAQMRNLSSDMKESQMRDWIVVDVGTGSGCVGISVLDEMAGNGKIEKLYLVDVSEGALEVAKDNVQRLMNEMKGMEKNRKIEVVKSDLLDGLNIEDVSGNNMLLVANLPYIPVGYEGVEDNVNMWEPELALYSGDDGLEHYRRLLDQVEKRAGNIKIGGEVVVLMEMMEWQVGLLQEALMTYDLQITAIHKTFHENIVMVEVCL